MITITRFLRNLVAQFQRERERECVVGSIRGCLLIRICEERKKKNLRRKVRDILVFLRTHHGRGFASSDASELQSSLSRHNPFQAQPFSWVFSIWEDFPFHTVFFMAQSTSSKRCFAPSHC